MGFICGCYIRVFGWSSMLYFVIAPKVSALEVFLMLPRLGQEHRKLIYDIDPSHSWELMKFTGTWLLVATIHVEVTYHVCGYCYHIDHLSIFSVFFWVWSLLQKSLYVVISRITLTSLWTHFEFYLK